MNAGVAQGGAQCAGVLGRCPVERRKIPDTSRMMDSSCFDRSTSRR